MFTLFWKIVTDYGYVTFRRATIMGGKTARTCYPLPIYIYGCFFYVYILHENEQNEHRIVRWIFCYEYGLHCFRLATSKQDITITSLRRR